MNPTTAPAVTVGIPAGVDPENVRSRKAALISAGVPEFLAEPVAATAAHQQHLRDHKLKESVVVKQQVVTAPVVTKQTEKVKGIKKSNPPKKIAVPTTAAVPAAQVEPAA